jgi:hypothetical protein
MVEPYKEATPGRRDSRAGRVVIERLFACALVPVPLSDSEAVSTICIGIYCHTIGMAVVSIPDVRSKKDISLRSLLSLFKK